MSREIRRVPADWEHPKDEHGDFVPLHRGGGFVQNAAEWDERSESDKKKESRPDPSEYMPNWPASERTHYQLYEDTSEGTPLSPAMETPEDLARWLFDGNYDDKPLSSYGEYLDWIKDMIEAEKRAALRKAQKTAKEVIVDLRESHKDWSAARLAATLSVQQAVLPVPLTENWARILCSAIAGLPEPPSNADTLTIATWVNSLATGSARS